MNAFHGALSMFYLCSASSLFAQVLHLESNQVSLYQLSHKPVKQARRLTEKGTQELRRHHYQASIELFGQALAIDPQNWQAQTNIAVAHQESGQRKIAEQEFRRAVEIDPGNPSSEVNLAISELLSRHYVEAEQLAREALRLQPMSMEAKAVMGIAKAGQGEWTPAVRRLLEEARSSVAAADALLREWPSESKRAGATELSLLVP